MILAAHRFIAERKANFRRARQIGIEATFDADALLLLRVHNEKCGVVVGATTLRINHFVGEFTQWLIVGQTAEPLIQFVVHFVTFEYNCVGHLTHQILDE